MTFREPWVIQKFLPQVAEGDKRIILVDGEALGAVNRVPVGDDIRSNMVRGGAARETELTAREREICARIGPELKRRGLLFVGIDVIDGHLTEINVTSPTGLRAIKRLGRPRSRRRDLGRDRGQARGRPELVDLSAPLNLNVPPPFLLKASAMDIAPVQSSPPARSRRPAAPPKRSKSARASTPK